MVVLVLREDDVVGEENGRHISLFFLTEVNGFIFVHTHARFYDFMTVHLLFNHTNIM